MTTQTKLDLTADTIDVRDIITRYEELFEQRVAESGKDPGDYGSFEKWHFSLDNSRDGVELYTLHELLDDLKGYGGDEEWRGDWYPLMLIRDSHFVDYATEMVKDCQFQCDELPSWIEIDWKKTAKNVQVDYSSVEINGVVYWYR